MKVVKNCASCNIDKASRSAPIIKDVLRDRLEPSAPFTHVHIDLAGPIDVRRTGVVTRKNTGTASVYIFLAVCRYSGALFLDVLQSYATDAVILALRKLSATHRLPEFVTSDRGTNLCGGKRILDRSEEHTS